MTKNLKCVFSHIDNQTSSEAVLCVHPGGLLSSNYQEIAAAVPEASLYVAELCMNMQFVGAADPAVPTDGLIEAIAGEVLAEFDELSKGKEIRVLCGWSFGGVIAHEIALQMAAEDRPAPTLLILDAIAPVQSYRFDKISSVLSTKGLSTSAGEQKNIATWFVAYLNSLKNCSIRLSRSEARSLQPDALLPTLLSRSIEAGAFPKTVSEAGFAKVFREFRRGMVRNTRLLADYVPHGPRQDILLIRASRPFFPIFRIFRKMGWDAIADKITLRTVRGDHYQLIARADSMRAVAGYLREYLARRCEPHPAGDHNIQCVVTSEVKSNV